MKIAVIGSGNVGRALALQAIKAGHEVVVGVKFPLSEKSKQLALEIGQEFIISVNQAVDAGDLIIIATPAHVILEIIAMFGDVNNKIIVDASNAVRLKPAPYQTAFDAIKKLTNCNQVVKCFNTTGFENLLNPIYGDQKIDLFAAGSHKEAKLKVMNLAVEMGFNQCYDFGGDDKVELLEQFALCWINLAIIQGHGRNIAMKVLTRK